MNCSFMNEDIILYNDLILVRHAEPVKDGNIPNSLLELTSCGEEQAKKASIFLKGKFDITICSTSKRTIMTAQIITRKNSVLTDERLLERGWGNYAQDGSETDEEAKVRIRKFILEVQQKYKGKRILLVTHGALMRLTQNVIERNNIIQQPVGYCTIVKYSKNKEKSIWNV